MTDEGYVFPLGFFLLRLKYTSPPIINVNMRRGKKENH